MYIYIKRYIKNCIYIYQNGLLLVLKSRHSWILDIQHDFIRWPRLPVTYRYTVVQNFKPNELETE